MNHSDRIRSGSRTLYERLGVVAGFAVLVAAGWLMAFPLRAAMDIFFLDEAGYLSRGVNMFPKIPKLWGPVYCLWYRILFIFESNPVDLFYLNFGAISVLLGLVLYGFLIRFRVALPVALWLSFTVLVASFNLPVFPKVSHFAAILGMAGLAMIYYIRAHQDRYLLVAFLFLVLSYVRPEFYLSFAICALGIVAGWLTGRIRLRLTPVFWVAAVLTLLMHIGLGMPLGVELRGYKRSFIAFGEHFSYNYSKWNDVPGYLWLTWESVMKEVFGDSRSLSSAFFANTPMFLKHMAYNAGLYLTQLKLTMAELIMPARHLPSAAGWIFPAGILMMLFVRKVRLRFFDRMRHHRALFIFLLLLALPSALSCILVYPRQHYIIIQLPLIAWLIAELAGSALHTVDWKYKTPAAAVLFAVLLGLYFTDARRPSDYTFFEMRKSTGKLNNLYVIDLFDANADVLEGKKLLSHEGDFSLFTEARIQFINAIDKKDQAFDDYLRIVEPDIIYCTQTIFNNPDYMDDATWDRFRNDLGSDDRDWIRVSVAGGPTDFLLVRPDLLEQLKIVPTR